MTKENVGSLSEDEMSAEVHLPTREFLYTLDQIAIMLDLSRKDLIERLVYFRGREVRRRSRQMIEAVNIAPPEQKPIWRVPESGFRLWLRANRITYTDPDRMFKPKNPPKR